MMVKTLMLIITLALFTNNAIANEAIEKSIRSAVWNKRVILLFNNQHNIANQQLAVWGDVNFDEWDLFVIQVPVEDVTTRAKYQVDRDNTVSVLIGKDGGEKWRSNRLVGFALLEDIIDRMPMRQQEKSQRHLDLNQ